MEVHKDGVCIAECSSVANAVLFHAAPELLEALKEAAEDLRYTVSVLCDKHPKSKASMERTLRKVEAAITEAEGHGRA
jgi:hypothetical protein